MNLNDPQYADMSVQDLIDEGLVGPEDVWTNMVDETMIMPIDTIEFLSEISDLDEGLVGPEDVWTNMVGETMIMPIDTIEFLSEIFDLDDDLTDEQLELFYSAREGNA